MPVFKDRNHSQKRKVFEDWVILKYYQYRHIVEELEQNKGVKVWKVETKLR